MVGLRFSVSNSSTQNRHLVLLAFALIPFMEYDVVFPSIFVNSLTFVFKTGGFSFTAQCFAFSFDCSFHSRGVCSSDSSLLSACVKKICSSSATSEEEVVTLICVVWISSLILRRIFSVTLSSSLERKSAAVLTEPAMCAILKLNCNTQPMHSRLLAGLPLFAKSGWGTCCLSGELLALLLPTECVQTRQRP